MNIECSWNQNTWDERGNTGEIRPIFGWRFSGDHRWSIAFNPVVDNSYIGVKRFEFVPATWLDFKIDDKWTVAAEEYDDFGTVSRFFICARTKPPALGGG